MGNKKKKFLKCFFNTIFFKFFIFIQIFLSFLFFIFLTFCFTLNNKQTFAIYFFYLFHFSFIFGFLFIFFAFYIYFIINYILIKSISLKISTFIHPIYTLFVAPLFLHYEKSRRKLCY